MINPPANGTVTGGGLASIAALSSGNVAVLSNVTPLVYTPHPDFVGADAFTYERCALDNPSVCALRRRDRRSPARTDQPAADHHATADHPPPPTTTTPPPTTTPLPAGTPPTATSVTSSELAQTGGSGNGWLAATGFGLTLLGVAGSAILVGAAVRALGARRRRRS